VTAASSAVCDESAVGLSLLLNQTQRTSFATNRDVSTVPSPDSLAESRIGFDLPDNDADDSLDFDDGEKRTRGQCANADFIDEIQL
jgi:hypothetical protein